MRASAATLREGGLSPRGRAGAVLAIGRHPAEIRDRRGKEKLTPVFAPVDNDATTVVLEHNVEQTIPSLGPAPSVPMTPNRPAIMTSAAFQTVLNAAPRVFTAAPANLLYSDQTHGRSLATLYRNREGFDATVLCIETELGGVIGAFVTSEWRPHQHRTYYGTGESFVFRAKGKQCTLFPWSGANNSFQLCCNDILAVGGGRPGLGAAIYLTSDLVKGESNQCPTFGSPCLSHTVIDTDRTHGEFAVASIEVWGFRRKTGRLLAV
ncbi:Oxidation resistance protein [Carpediemonas membranifera]|uniref:Oxidation resistance protein 1 n=1 Tax=Carpediemonas membranifera TaxID=201153 RepID=A0A8J6AX14_9EUKA|nr:Oxidation resistance protein [Carpediemonas membranifera]|eukprot:KAG9396976.1 Oxidation resistance protein [Carpediemonas membranifera]